MTIAAILQTKGGDVLSLAPDDTLSQAIALLADKRIGAAPVIENGQILGIFSERDVIRCLNADGAAALDKRVRDAMTTPVRSVDRNEPVIGALSLMTRQRIRHLPVVDGGTMIGFVSIGDLVKYRIDRIEADAAAMREYIQSV
ncbi:CBS domain-containing protein [Sphingomonas sp. R86521]|uniref:CBS domain-containing protein n=1 Tax=Sphingomonas sp. R86521 TaxID=3093860 RepID=UPI0036D2B6D7